MHYMRYARSDLSGLLPAWLYRLLAPWRARRHYFRMARRDKED